MTTDRLHLGTVLVLLAATGFGLNPLFARLLYAEGIGAEVATFYRFAIPALILLPLVVARLRPGDGPEALRMALLGMVNAVGTLAYFHAIAVVPVSTAILIYYTYPVFSVLVGWIAWRRRPSREAVTAALLVLVAASLVVRPAGIAPGQGWAVAACFLAPFAFAAIIQYLAAPVAPMGPVRRLGTSMLGHVAVLAPVLLVIDAGPLMPATPAGLSAMAGIALAAALIPQMLFTLGAPLAGADRTAVAGAGEMVVAMLVGVAVFGDRLGQQEITAMVLIAIALTLRQRAPAMAERTA